MVNKSTSLDKNYVPSDLVWVDLRGVRETQLRQEAADALENLFKEADSKAITLYCCSGYRSYETQQELYQENVKTYGQKQTDLVSAKPGRSEHQTGLAMDVTAESVNLDLDETV
ncbi:MAG TPA: M15 family metallopeptidase [Acetobacterium sp.]